jgi:hypothetical protein
MTGGALVNFLVVVLLLIAIVAILYAAAPKLAPDPTLLQIAKIAIGVGALVVFILAVASVLGFGGQALTLTPGSMFYVAIAVIVILVVVYIINWMVDFFQVPFAQGVKFIVGAIALIAILVAVGAALTGGGIPSGTFLKRGAIDSPMHWVAARSSGLPAAASTA